MNDHEVLFVLGPVVLLLAIACELAWRNRYIPQWVARKVLHVGAIGACALAPLWLEDLALLRWIVIASEIILIWLVLSGQLFNQTDGSRSWGIMLFPLPYLLLLFIEPDRWLIALPMLILAFSDAMAAVAGNLFARDFYQLTGYPRSISGNIAFFTTTIILLLVLPAFPALVASLSVIDKWMLMIAIALLLTLIEALGARGWDNFFIPLAAWALLSELSAIPVVMRGGTAMEMGVGLVLAMLFVPLTVRMRWLNAGGGVAAALIGLWVLFFAGWPWLIPLFLFLIAGTAIGRTLRGTLMPSTDDKQGRPRDAVQVLCNGGVFALAATLFDHPMASIAMAVSIAISAADTWASEIGIAFRTITRDILTWRRVPPGLSGGISLPGTIGALSGAFLFGLVGAQLAGLSQFFWHIMALVTVAGMAGMFLDSMLGSTLQPRYRLADGTLSDKGIPSQKIKGLGWMSNDMVNLLSNAWITGLVVLLLEIIYGMRHSFAQLF